MGLRETAAADCAIIVQDPAGFGWPITVTNPAGLSAALVGISNDIAHSIDPDTGTAVTGRRPECVLSIAALIASGLCTSVHNLPVSVPDSAGKPWIVRFDDIHGFPWTFKVASSAPDLVFGIVRCFLEAYRA